MLGLLAGCSGGSHTSPASPSRITLDPIDVAGYTGRPCALVRPDQLAQHHQPAGTPSGRDCNWPAASTDRPSFTAHADTTSGGLDPLRRHPPPFFEPTTIGGYPAAHTDTDHGGPQHGHCTVNVGVADSSLVVVTATYENRSAANATAPCPDADMFATLVLSNIKTAAP
ncbi:DUF3558 domain-containing protein [Gandjariella thermophila]|uniref:DUF3558 domain-containing protein n=1 Tax=Gandjariella thermophila TaxID=1931992 RepID=A0A4D4JEE9_9PSEU|nr:DUF3558 domain-containing protein [Gandjariella thermophila]GDY33792.1 hypothetical protein GTS_54250 [Gandjariella thermophila]